MTASEHFFVSCERGAEGALRRELVALGIHAPRGERAGVSFDGTFEQGMKICLASRTAMRVLQRLHCFQAPDAQALYEATRSVAWTEHLTLKTTFAIRAVAHGSTTLTHSRFVAQKVKDAVADHMREHLGARPDVDADDPDVLIGVHVSGTDASLFLDLSGVPLHRRGYRVAMTTAPLKETLAAAVLRLGDVAAELPFLDPMGGSGTFAIEHALAARQIPPGRGRRFGFQRWPSEERRRAWPDLCAQAEAGVLPRALAPIVCRDRDGTAIEAARQNARVAGVADDVQFEVGDIRRLGPPFPNGTLVMNPPYGERLERSARPLPQERELARVLSFFRGWRLVILCVDEGLAQALGARPDFTHRLSNGGIDIRLVRYSF